MVPHLKIVTLSSLSVGPTVWGRRNERHPVNLHAEDDPVDPTKTGPGETKGAQQHGHGRSTGRRSEGAEPTGEGVGPSRGCRTGVRGAGSRLEEFRTPRPL